MNIWNTMIIKTRSFNKRSAHISDHKCMSWAMHSSWYDASQNESELKVSYLKNFLSFCHWSKVTLIKWQRCSRKKIKILQEKFFSSFFQTDINDIADSFIFLTMSSDLHISEDEVREIIKRVKVNKALNISDISNKALQTDLAKLILILMSLFNVCVIHRYHSKQFKKAQTIVLCKSKKSDYTDLKTYQLIALLDIMSKALKLIMTKRLSNIAETHHMLSDAQMKARCKQFMISTLNLLVDQIHTVWDCKIKYVTFMLSLNIIKAFNQVLHIRLLHTLKWKELQTT